MLMTFNIFQYVFLPIEYTLQQALALQVTSNAVSDSSQRNSLLFDIIPPELNTHDKTLELVIEKTSYFN